MLQPDRQEQPKMIQEWIRHSIESKLRGGVAVLVDGENISSDLAGQIVNRACTFGTLVVKRVYGNATQIPRWEAAPGFKIAHAGSGKNATDLLLAIEAVSLFHEGSIDTVVIASSDRDFSHLAHHLRERQIAVIGMGEAKTPPAFRQACCSFVELCAPPAATIAPPPATTAKPLDIDKTLVAFVRAAMPAGCLITAINAEMHRAHKISISERPEKTWRAYMIARPHLFACDPKGPEARVRLVEP
jgi:uncharacterized LabA/DUF88 family protein